MMSGMERPAKRPRNGASRSEAPEGTRRRAAGAERSTMKTTRIAWLMAAAWMGLVATAPLHAQGSPTGILNGTVSDPSGAVLPGVTVIAKGTETGLTQQTVSGASGD